MAERIGVLGAGYVGLTSAACFAHLGHDVTCVDTDQSKVDMLRHGTVPIDEPGLPELVEEGLAAGRLAFTTDPADLADATLVLLCLPTPPDHDGRPDLGILETAVAELSHRLPAGCVVVTKSTVPVGTAARLPALLGRDDLPVVSNPEFLREGHAVDDFLHPERVLVGTDALDPAAASRVAALYAGATVVRTNAASAELAKYASNAFLAVKLSYVNVLAELSERYGADIRDVVRTMGLDRRIGPEFLTPGPGWGGSCLPKDTTGLLHIAESAGVDFDLLRGAVRVNARQRARTVRTIRHAVTGSFEGSLAGARIGLLGLAFKAGTGDVRDSPALAVAAELARQGAELTAHDPAVAELPGMDIQVVDDPYLAAKDAVALVVLTEWPEFRDLDWTRMAANSADAVVVDTRDILNPNTLSAAGLTHVGVGRRPEVQLDYTVVIPTTGRDTLRPIVDTLDQANVIVVDDRPDGPDLDLPPGVRVLRSGGRGPAAARNVGWRAADSEWIAFLDDDVRIPPDWPQQLVNDLLPLPPQVAACQGRIVVPLPPDRRPTDDERGTAGLQTARWITADMAYRRSVLVEVGGFDERFPRAFREDSDLALRVTNAGHDIVKGDRVTTHPARRAGFFASVRAQRGNADNALMRHKHGAAWRDLTAAGKGRLTRHALSTVSGVAAAALGALGQRKAALAAAGVWAGVTGEFAARRIASGPKSFREMARMALTSVLIPPAACYHRIRGEISVRRAPVAVLFDRDDTLVVDVPYLDDPDKVRPVPGAVELVRDLRARGIPVGVVSNQSGVAKGLITPDRLAAVNARIEEIFGSFDTWQVCVHDAGDGCACRKPSPGLVVRAAKELGMSPTNCVVIGDTGADVDAALAAGARAVLVPTGRTLPEEIERASQNALVARDLAEAVRLVGIRA